MEKTAKSGLNSAHLKIFAVVCMLIDHIGAFLLEYTDALYPVCRSIGRLAFPIFCWLIVEGAIHTRSTVKYAARLAIFALISTPPYNLVYGDPWYSLKKLNVFFTLLFGLLAVASIQKLAPMIFRSLNKFKLSENKNACTLLGLPFCIALYFAAYALNTDYGGYGVAAIVLFYLLKENQPAAWISFALFTFISYDFVFVGAYDYVEMNLYDIIQHCVWQGNYNLQFVNSRQVIASLACIPIAFYTGKKGSSAAKYFFYAFYPIHLLLIGIISALK